MWFVNERCLNLFHALSTDVVIIEVICVILSISSLFFPSTAVNTCLGVLGVQLLRIQWYVRE